MSGMERRYQYNRHPAFKAMLALEEALQPFDKPLAELLKLRVSQMNGCAYCVQMHVRDARKIGVPAAQLDLLAAWREAGKVFDARTRAALGWAESVTRIAETQAPDDVYAEARRYFDEDQMAALTFGIATINAWNRIAISSRQPLEPM
jgi:AhpD family alkylhydroperoxidase